MPTLFRRGSLALAFGFLLAAVSPASAQTTVPAADAAKFMGAWALTFAEGPQGPFNVTATVTADNGQTAAEVSSDSTPRRSR
jgi:hypothetical protein